ncbi:MAG: DUF3592 domain-containing protein [Clostridium sp.]|nr:DUF3592 domain-containing protein [Clostridium sp.]MDY4078676.1 DUF3592 domain-containing protein [Clostridium sp.]
MKNNIKVYSTLMIIIGIVCIFGGIGLFVHNNNAQKSMPSTEAVITNYNVHYSNNSKKSSKTFIVSYEVEGKRYENVDIGYSNSNKHIGDTITIFYELNNPEYVIAKGSEYVFPGFLGFLGVVLLLIGKSMKNE